MENLTAVDGGAALIILVSAILAFSRGLVRELMAIVGWIGAAIAGVVLLAFFLGILAKALKK